MMWWRIVKHEINSFTKFEEKFTENYWSGQIQELIQDQLEYGKYCHNGGLNAIQYMEKQILQCRQLIPPILVQHKLAQKIISTFY